MDSQDSSAPPPHLSHLHHHPQPSHPAALHTQPQRHLPSNSYLLPNSNNAVNPTTTTHTHQQNPGFPFNSMAGGAPKPLDHLQPDGSPSGARKKRGRPRKYSPDNSIGLGLSPAPVSQIPTLMAHNDSGGGGTPPSEMSAKRNRGRPPGTVKRQLDALGVPGVGFTPHVITVNAGEDIASKILAFSQQGPRTVCILSANGAICNVTLRQPAMSGGGVTYEGRFEIISLSGSFLLSESIGNCSRTGGLSISLAGSDGRVLGGGVSGMLKAASPVQVVVGSFIPEGKKSKIRASSTPPSYMFNFDAPETGAGASPSPGGSSETGEENDDSPLNHGSGPYGNAGQPGQTMPMYNSVGWPNSMKVLPN
ncbi:AT-hook motif nuclear-localized protein 13-like [Salvia miltiorrhiza]|uniref:AT-hook motif nuclear-localized protein 13-like n=1 Tax=Salvia miltiorrhiza TaxID=226208 RepID=UPI0025AB69DE|nr:AT-hook motif nuclear-localized protein 13-like [Salvia miltiorrhiza]